MKCDIIQDLIPSYVDEICSDATRECVEEHIKNCKECQQMLTFCQESTPSGKKIDQKGLDGLKKIKQAGQLKGLVCCGVALFLLVCQALNQFTYSHILPMFFSNTVIQIACSVLMILSGLGYSRQWLLKDVRNSALDVRNSSKAGRGAAKGGRVDSNMMEWAMALVASSVCVYIFILILSMTRMMQAGENSFWGMEPENTGPFIVRQIIIGFVLCMMLLLYALFRILKYGKGSNWLPCLLMADSFLLIQYASLLNRMDAPETWMLELVYTTVQTIVIGGMGISASILISDYYRKKM